MFFVWLANGGRLLRFRTVDVLKIGLLGGILEVIAEGN